jgi:hypothetical protein
MSKRKADFLILSSDILGLTLARALFIKNPSLKIHIQNVSSKYTNKSISNKIGLLNAGFNCLPGSLKSKLCNQGN